jgi:hypothetical protein
LPSNVVHYDCAVKTNNVPRLLPTQSEYYKEYYQEDQNTSLVSQGFTNRPNGATTKVPLNHIQLGHNVAVVDWMDREARLVPGPGLPMKK